MALIAGILNLTPDSFSDGGCFNSPEKALAQAEKLINEGVDLFDLGAESTRPQAEPVSIQEELDRLLPVIEVLKPLGLPLSVDTRKTAVMKEVLKLGVEMINDVNALQDEGALELLSKAKAKVCLMHMQGQPKTMQEAPSYEDVVTEVYDFLKARIEICEAAGIEKARIVIDPGFGFGKTLSHNLRLLGSLEKFKDLDCPLLVGLSRKSMFGQITGKPPQERSASSLAATVISLLQGASIIRTHEVAPVRDAISVLLALQEEMRS